MIGETSSWFGDLNLTMWIDTRMQKDLSLIVLFLSPTNSVPRKSGAGGKFTMGKVQLEWVYWMSGPGWKKTSRTSQGWMIRVAHKKSPMIHIWMFPKIGIPQNGWFIMENPIKMDDLGLPLFLEPPIWFMGQRPYSFKVWGWHLLHDWKLPFQVQRIINKPCTVLMAKHTGNMIRYSILWFKKYDMVSCDTIWYDLIRYDITCSDMKK